MAVQRRTPQEKKRLSLKRDHPLLAEYPKRFRKTWPVKRRKAQKSFRLKVAQELHRAVEAKNETLAEDVIPERISRKKVRKWGAAPLGQVIKWNRKHRERSYGRKKDAQAKRRRDTGTTGK